VIDLTGSVKISWALSTNEEITGTRNERRVD
jgi:hypothetical protein